MAEYEMDEALELLGALVVDEHEVIIARAKAAKELLAVLLEVAGKIPGMSVGAGPNGDRGAVRAAGHAAVVRATGDGSISSPR